MTIQKPAEQTWGGAERGLLQTYDGILYVNEAACCGFIQHADQSSHRQPTRYGNLTRRTLIEENQVGVQALGQDDGVAFAPVEALQHGVSLIGYNSFDVQP